MNNTQRITSTEAELVAALEAAGAQKVGRAWRCPFHDDKHPSGEIRGDEAGHWRFYCHAGGCGFKGDALDVQARARHGTVGDVLRDKRQGGAKTAVKTYTKPEDIWCGDDKVERVYYYATPDGENQMASIRIRKTGGGKMFRLMRPEGDGWADGAPAKPWPLYRLPEIVEADTVVIAEGEKCVEALRSVGVVATTSAGGAMNHHCTDWGPLAGKDVCLWPDNDGAGVRYMEDVASAIQDAGCRVTMVDPTRLGLPDKGDVADLVANMIRSGVSQENQKSVVAGIVEGARPTAGPAGEVEALLSATISGERSAIPWPWTNLTHMSKSLLPGTMTVLCGEPGAGKSFFVLQAAAYWHSIGIPVAVTMLEESRAWHLTRALAQRAESSALLDDAWIHANADESRQAFEEHRDFLDSFGRVIHAESSQQLDLKSLGEWVQAKAERGCRVIVVDPVTMADTGPGNSWDADKGFVKACKHAAESCGASVLLVTHPKKRGPKDRGIGLDALAGGTAYVRFSQCVLWLQKHKPPQATRIVGSCGTFGAELNRTLHICKARNGTGGGMGIGFEFSGETLLFAEQGLIVDTE